MRSFAKVILFAAVVVVPAASRADGQAGKGAQGRAGRGPRQMRTLKVEGGYIRYEVLPGDADEPPGQVIVIESERSAARRAATSATVEQRNGDREARATRAPADRCRRQRARLAARFFELKGLEVSDDVALWLQEHPTFYAPDPLSLSNNGPTLAALLQNDATARAYAEELVRCERAQGAR